MRRLQIFSSCLSISNRILNRYRKARAENLKAPFTQGAFEISARQTTSKFDKSKARASFKVVDELKIRRRLLHGCVLAIKKKLILAIWIQVVWKNLGCVLQLNFFFSNWVLKFRVRLAFECVLYSRKYGTWTYVGQWLSFHLVKYGVKLQLYHFYSIYRLV